MCAGTHFRLDNDMQSSASTLYNFRLFIYYLRLIYHKDLYAINQKCKALI